MRLGQAGPYVSKLISAEGGRKFWPLGGVINPRQQGGVRGGRLEFPKSPIFSGILLFRALPSIYVHNNTTVSQSPCLQQGVGLRPMKG